MLYRPSETEKFSLCLSVVRYFHLNIYILSLYSIDDECLRALFTDLSQQCVILLKDIDAASSVHQDTEVRDFGSASEHTKSTQGRVSLSALFNVINDVASQEGRLLIMTTNHIKRLDSALIQPGCVNMKLEFRLADKKMMTQLFYVIFQHSDVNIPHLEMWVEDNKTVKQLAEEFSARVSKLKFSAAEILSFLLVNKQSARQAVDNVKA